MPSGIRFNPENISAALFSLLSSANFSFNSKDRRGKIWSNIDAADQPYMGLIERGATGVQDTTIGLEKWTLHYLVLVYIRADANPTVVPATQINAALQAIAEIIQSIPPGMRQQLGSLGVNNVWINGECVIDTGILDQQCALLIPVDVQLGI